MKRRWDAIPGTAGVYEASTDGAVRSVTRIVTVLRNGRAYVQTVRGKTLRVHLARTGYFQVSLRLGGRSRTKLVHRLIALTHVAGRSKSRRFVNHRDGCKQRNTSTNLEWCTALENQRHAIDRGMVPIVYGDDRSCKLTAAQVRAMCVVLSRRRWGDQARLCRKYGVTRGMVSLIAAGAAWGHLPEVRALAAIPKMRGNRRWKERREHSL